MTSRFIHILFFMAMLICHSEVARAQTLLEHQRKMMQERARTSKVHTKPKKQEQARTSKDYAKPKKQEHTQTPLLEQQDRKRQEEEKEDSAMWKKASSENTISAFKRYLNESKQKNFKEKADSAISGLQAEEKWDSVKNSPALSDIERFMSEYPDSPRMPEARKRKHELTGVSLYLEGNLNGALIEFDEAGGRDSLRYSNRALYDECKEHRDYSRLTSLSGESELESFLNTYPDSKYSNDVSNKLAIVKSKGMTMFSDEHSLRAVLAYAKDDYTRAQIRNYYDERMREYARYKKEQRRAKRRSDGGTVGLGIIISDVALNPAIFSDYNNNFDYDVMYYDAGLGLRFFNYKSPAQLEVGARIGFALYRRDYETRSSFHLPLYARLKINLGGGERSKWYVDGVGYYNAVKDSFLEGDLSLSAGLGISWRHWDWRVLYYRQGIGAIPIYSDYKFLGTSFGYYF